jgi:enterochelin esterase family protein
MGASLGALAMLHAHRAHPGTFGALFLQSGSFFRPRLDGHERGFARFTRIVRFTGSLASGGGWAAPVPVVMTCGANEENAANNRFVRDALRRHGYPVELHEGGDLHTWTGWRDALDPGLASVLRGRAR